MRRVGRFGMGLAAAGLVALPGLQLGCTPPVQCPTGSVALVIDSASQARSKQGSGPTEALYLVGASGRLVNDTTAAVAWTGTYPVGRVDGNLPMVLLNPSEFDEGPPPPSPPISAGNVESYRLAGFFLQRAGQSQSHAVAVGITNMTWADSRYASCATPAGSIVVRQLPLVSYKPPR